MEVNADDVRAFIAKATDKNAHVVRLDRLAGGASHEAWALDVTFDGEKAVLALVMRRSMGGALTTLALSREQEFAVLGAAHGNGVPAPKPYWLAGAIDGRPAFFMERVDGETVGRKIVADPAFALLHGKLTEDFARILAGIHRVDYRKYKLDAFLHHPAEGKSAAQSEIARLYRELDDLDEPHPAIELGLRWLVLHEPPASTPAFVHGDYRMGNVVVDNEGIRCVLDWEFAHVGDPVEDIGWLCVRAWRFGGSGRLGGIGDVATFLRAYRAAGGGDIDERAVFYWEVMGNVKWALGALHQARRHLKGEERSIELASLGRIAAEMEYELLHLIEGTA